jgi:diguanylate cyclase (GGDEF)-like protein
MTEASTITVLLLEDSDSDAELFNEALREGAPNGFEVLRATTLRDAATQLASWPAHCAVVDLGLADAQGLEAVELLAARSPEVALVVLTGRQDDELGAASIVAGASDYLSKNGLDGRSLIRSIRHAILRKRFEMSFAEAQSIAHVGSWELDVTSNAYTWSRELYRVFDLDPDVRPSPDRIDERTHPDDRQVVQDALRTTMANCESFEIEHRVLARDGVVRWVRQKVRAEPGNDGLARRVLGTVQDFTNEKAAQDALVHEQSHDLLTGLPNRPQLLDRLSRALSRLADQPGTVALIYLDIDRFMVVNDSLGLPVGDQLLLVTAERIRSIIPPDLALARVGGDEFCVLCGSGMTRAEIIELADEICATMTIPIEWEGGLLVLSVSAGVGFATGSSVTPHELLRDANAAVFLAQREGRARAAIFEESMRTTAVGRLDTEVALRRSIADGDLRVHYQQIVTLTDGYQPVGHEALVRWMHPRRGLIPPDEFITIAEETGLIVPLGSWVLREACLQAKRFETLHPRWSRLTMSVNLSGVQLGQADLIEMIAAALRESNLRSDHLQLEMTESVLMNDAANTITVLQQLKGLGVKLGIDDFGTGYSSLAYLRRFPVDVLKIDRTFVNGLGKDLEDSAVAAAVVSLADTLGLTTVAEGVETDLQRDCLVGLGCVRAQGYLFARPVAASAAEAVLTSFGDMGGTSG